MSTAAIGFLYAGATLGAMLSGIPIAFALGFVALAFMVAFMPGASLDTVAQNVYEEMASITLLSIPLLGEHVGWRRWFSSPIVRGSDVTYQLTFSIGW